MITIEEMIVQGMYHKLVVVNVKRSPGARMDGLGLLFTGAVIDQIRTSLLGRRPFQQQGQLPSTARISIEGPGAHSHEDDLGSEDQKEPLQPICLDVRVQKCLKKIKGGDEENFEATDMRQEGKSVVNVSSDNRIEFSKEVETVMENSKFKITRSVTTSTESDSDFLPILYLTGMDSGGAKNSGSSKLLEGSGNSLVSGTDSGALMTSLESGDHELAAFQQMLATTPAINLASVHQFSIVQFQDVRDSSHSLVVVQANDDPNLIKPEDFFKDHAIKYEQGEEEISLLEQMQTIESQRSSLLQSEYNDRNLQHSPSLTFPAEQQMLEDHTTDLMQEQFNLFPSSLPVSQHSIVPSTSSQSYSLQKSQNHDVNGHSNQSPRESHMVSSLEYDSGCWDVGGSRETKYGAKESIIERHSRAFSTENLNLAGLSLTSTPYRNLRISQDEMCITSPTTVKAFISETKSLKRDDESQEFDVQEQVVSRRSMGIEATFDMVDEDSDEPQEEGTNGCNQIEDAKNSPVSMTEIAEIQEVQPVASNNSQRSASGVLGDDNSDECSVRKVHYGAGVREDTLEDTEKDGLNSLQHNKVAAMKYDSSDESSFRKEHSGVGIREGDHESTDKDVDSISDSEPAEPIIPRYSALSQTENLQKNSQTENLQKNSQNNTAECIQDNDTRRNKASLLRSLQFETDIDKVEKQSDSTLVDEGMSKESVVNFADLKKESISSDNFEIDEMAMSPKSHKPALKSQETQKNVDIQPRQLFVKGEFQNVESKPSTLEFNAQIKQDEFYAKDGNIQSLNTSQTTSTSYEEEPHDWHYVDIEHSTNKTFEKDRDYACRKLIDDSTSSYVPGLVGGPQSSTGEMENQNTSWNSHAIFEENQNEVLPKYERKELESGVREFMSKSELLDTSQENVDVDLPVTSEFTSEIEELPCEQTDQKKGHNSSKRKDKKGKNKAKKEEPKRRLSNMMGSLRGTLSKAYDKVSEAIESVRNSPEIRRRGSKIQKEETNMFEEETPLANSVDIEEKIDPVITQDVSHGISASVSTQFQSQEESSYNMPKGILLQRGSIGMPRDETTDSFATCVSEQSGRYQSLSENEDINSSQNLASIGKKYMQGVPTPQRGRERKYRGMSPLEQPPSLLDATNIRSSSRLERFKHANPSLMTRPKHPTVGAMKQREFSQSQRAFRPTELYHSGQRRPSKKKKQLVKLKATMSEHHYKANTIALGELPSAQNTPDAEDDWTPTSTIPHTTVTRYYSDTDSDVEAYESAEDETSSMSNISIETRLSELSMCNHPLLSPFTEYDQYSDWMSQLPKKLHDVPLSMLAIPGSNVSLAIESHMRVDMNFSKCNLEMAEFLRKLPHLAIFDNFRTLMKNIWKSWMSKQMLNISQQLDAGVRYFDIRISKWRSAYYGEHGLYTKQLKRYLMEFEAFIVEHPAEILILHFQSFENLSPKDKRALVTQMFQTFKAKLCTVRSMKDVTLEKLWKDEVNIIAIFPDIDEEGLRDHIFGAFIWSDKIVQGVLPRKQTTEELLGYLEVTYDAEERKEDAFHITRGVVSPDLSMVFGDYHYKSMRELAVLEVNPPLVNWIGGKTNVNIVSSDFIGSNDFVGQVIDLNYSKNVETVV